MNTLKSLFVVGLVLVTSSSLLASGKPKASKSSKAKPAIQSVAAKSAKPGPQSIAAIVAAPDGEFDVLLAAVQRAGLVDALSGNRQLTVFAPTDKAFVESLGLASDETDDATEEAAAIAAVQSLDLGVLTEVLLFHVIPGRRTSTSVLAAPSYETLSGAYLTRSELAVAGIKTTDISASNGVIHVINGVLGL
jgi:uncharacterized surface protein with fasciclin (FAS1) repeats